MHVSIVRATSDAFLEADSVLAERKTDIPYLRRTAEGAKTQLVMNFQPVFLVCFSDGDSYDE